MTEQNRFAVKAVAVTKWALSLLLLGTLAACPRGPSFTVRINNESTDKAATTLQIFDDTVGQPVSDDLLVGPNVGPGRSRTITVPLSVTEGGTALLVESARASDGRGGISLVQGVREFAEGHDFIATIFDDHIELDEEN